MTAQEIIERLESGGEICNVGQYEPCAKRLVAALKRSRVLKSRRSTWWDERPIHSLAAPIPARIRNKYITE